MVVAAVGTTGREVCDGPPSPPLLTILTVCIRKHHDDIRRHIELMDRLNPGANWRLIVVDNSGGNADRFRCDDPRVEVREGVPLDLTKPLDSRFSYHHAVALNSNLRGIEGYLLVIDPDLFVVYPDWMKEAVAHMRDRGLCFFGVPWHPRWYTKYRYFPAVHFLMIDLARVPVAKLDFCPDIVENPGWSRRHQAALSQRAHPTENPFRQAVRQLGWRLLNGAYRAGYFVLSRHLIGSSRDTGWRVWARFSADHSADFALPVVDLENDFTAPDFLKTKLGRAADVLFPERFRFLPREGSYVSPGEAKTLGLPDLQQLRAEGFVWRKSAFAFHRRSFMQPEGSGDDDALKRAWSTMLETYQANSGGKSALNHAR